MISGSHRVFVGMEYDVQGVTSARKLIQWRILMTGQNIHI
jgi:hypothetical protein